MYNITKFYNLSKQLIQTESYFITLLVVLAQKLEKPYTVSEPRKYKMIGNTSTKRNARKTARCYIKLFSLNNQSFTKANNISKLNGKLIV